MLMHVNLLLSVLALKIKYCLKKTTHTNKYILSPFHEVEYCKKATQTPINMYN